MSKSNEGQVAWSRTLARMNARTPGRPIASSAPPEVQTAKGVWAKAVAKLNAQLR